MQKENNTRQNPAEIQRKEIDLLVIARSLWADRKLVFLITLLAIMMGIITALLTPVEYSAWTTMVPQSSKSVTKLGGLSSLAAMAGFNLDMADNAETLSPLVYPQIVNSVPFQLELMETPFRFSKVDHPVSLYEYYIEIAKPNLATLLRTYTLELPGTIRQALKGESDIKQQPKPGEPIFLTRKQEKMRKMLSQKVYLSVEEMGYLSLRASFHEAGLSAQVANQAREQLQEYITKHKTRKATEQLQFVEERFNEKKQEFEKAQEELALFRDQNRNVSSALAATREDRLQSNYTIALNVYNELAKQLEQAKIKVKEETPVFSVLEPAVVPQLRTKPKRAMTVLIWTFVGFIGGIVVVFGKQYFSNVKTNWNNTI